jgi:hypothetical protein
MANQWGFFVLASWNQVLLEREADSLCWTNLSRQRIKLLGKRRAGSTSGRELPLTNHVDELNAGENSTGGLEGFEV